MLARYARNRRLGDALQQWAFCSLRGSPGDTVYYRQLRARNIGHHAALRQLANRLVGILHGCLKTGPAGATRSRSGRHPRPRPCPSCGWSSSAATAVQTRFSTCSPVTGVTLDIGRGMRDEVDDRESGWARQVDESVTQIVEHGYFRLRAKAADHGNARACCPTRDRLRPRPFAQLGPPLPRTRRAPSGHRAWADRGSAQRVPRCPAPSASGRQCRCEVSACVPPSLGGTLLVSHSGGGTSTPDSDTWTPSDIRCSNAHATTGLQHQLHLGPQVLLVHPLMVPAPARARH